MFDHWLILLGACLMEAAFGYPHWIYARIRHPVVWIGACITVLEAKLNHLHAPASARRMSGVLAMGILLAATLFSALVFQKLGDVWQMPAMASLLASRSLYDHVRQVYAALYAKDIEAARQNVSRIVGRDVAALDEAGICRAAIESLAESFCDAVVAPLFWAACFGLPGIACYKAINTADSMIGHKDARYRQFGWAAARMDDAANFIPARLSGLLIALAARSTTALRIMWRDARHHASPNAGWPEASMAGALGLRLAGPQTYDGVACEAAFIGDGTRDAAFVHIRRALDVYIRACGALWLILGLAWLVPCILVNTMG